MVKYITFSLVLISLLTANLLLWHDKGVGLIFVAIYFLYFGHRLGVLALPRFSAFWQRLFGPLILLFGLSIAGSIIYTLYALNAGVIIFLLLIVPAGLIPYCHLFKKKIDEWPGGELEETPMIEPTTKLSGLLAWLVIAGDFILIRILYLRGTGAVLQSPWQLVSWKFFLAFALLTFLLLIFVKRTESSKLSVFTIFVHSLLMVSVAYFVYKLGFGFDPFIHRAAENFIDKFGAILPKTPYYIGQYVLVVALAKLTAISIGTWDKFLLPFLEALFIPPLVFLALRHGLNLERWQARLGSILFFLWPFTSFISTTPQDMANFLAIVTILFGLLYLATNLVPWWLPLIFTMAALITHPLTGLPLVIYYFLIILEKTPGRQRLLYLPAILLSLAILPLVFIFFAHAGWHAPHWGELGRMVMSALPQPRPDQPFSWLQSWLYVYNFLLPLIFVIFSIFGSWELWEKEPAKRPFIWLSWLIWLVFIANAGILRLCLTFSGVSAAEQGQYPARLYHFSFYLLLPLFLYGIIFLINKISGRKTALVFIALSLLLTVSFYLSYPRVDAYSYSRYFNTSATDILAVRQIAQKSVGADYIVLGNTSFSAAAIQEYGFQKYFSSPSGPLFFYALPTGGPLYQLYEKMVYEKTSRETMNEAMDMAGVKLSYLVLHNYWNSFKTAEPKARAAADEWWQLDSGRVEIFQFKK